jgi:hypothetical protein
MAEAFFEKIRERAEPSLRTGLAGAMVMLSAAPPVSTAQLRFDQTGYKP